MILVSYIHIYIYRELCINFLIINSRKANYLLVPEGLVNNSVNQNFH